MLHRLHTGHDERGQLTQAAPPRTSPCMPPSPHCSWQCPRPETLRLVHPGCDASWCVGVWRPAAACLSQFCAICSLALFDCRADLDLAPLSLLQEQHFITDLNRMIMSAALSDNVSWRPNVHHLQHHYGHLCRMTANLLCWITWHRSSLDEQHPRQQCGEHRMVRWSGDWATT